MMNIKFTEKASSNMLRTFGFVLVVSISMQTAFAQEEMNHDAMSMQHMEQMDHSNMQPSEDNNSATDNMNHSSMQDMDHSAMQTAPQDHSAHNMDHSSMPGMTHNMNQSSVTMSAGDMSTMNHGTMQSKSLLDGTRDPHAFADGYDFGSIPRPRLGDQHNFGMVLLDRLEIVHNADNTSASYDAQAWYGRDYERLLVKAEGAYDNKEFEDTSTELLWSHAFSTFWNSQLGLRYDYSPEANRTWLAFGIQGLAPYWFEIDASGYIGEQGRSAFKFAAEYDLLFTQRLILQPQLQTELYGKDDAEQGIGKGLSALTAGVRLRYEVKRWFAPYIGILWNGKFGNTADYIRAAGMDTKETQAVAGIRMWF